LNLLSGRADLHGVAEARSCRLQTIDPCRKIGGAKNYAVPTARLLTSLT